MEISKHPVHQPKHRNSDIKCLPENQLDKQWMSDKILITTETWTREPDKPWSESGVIIGRLGYKWITRWEEGLSYVITKFIDNNENFVAVYCDMTSQVKKKGDLFEYIDYYLDVFQTANAEPLLLDEDEFEKAVKASFLSAEEAYLARKTAKYVIDNLKNGNIQI